MDSLGDKDGVCTYRWTISDTGVGMSEEFLKHIFEPFAQERADARSIYQGTGLGMSIVKKLIEKMNGTIRVTSREGEGSVFVIELPFEIAPEPQEPARAEQKPGDIRGLHLLMAEDNDLNAEIAKTLLEDRGASVHVVTDGRMALNAFRGCPEGTYDAILMDVMMPVMDGIEAAKAIRALPRPDAGTIPILAMTANAFLTKPLDMDKVAAALAEAVGR